MSEQPKLNRRAFVAGQAVIAVAGLSAAAGAAPFKSKATWQNLTAKELSPMIGDKFIAHCEDGRRLDLKLTAAEASKSGWRRPMALPRREGVTAVFSCPQVENFAELEHQTVRITHKDLGGFDLFLGAVPRRNGGCDIEAVLN